MMTASPASAIDLVWPSEVRRVLRAPSAQALGGRRRAAGVRGGARAGRVRSTASASTRSGSSSTTSSRSTATRRAPEMFLAALSQRTKHIRLGHGIVHTPPAINHPGPPGRADRDPRHRVGRARRVRHRRGLVGRRARRVRRRPRPTSAAMWEEGLRVALRCMTRDAVHRLRGRARARCRRATSCPSPCSSRTRRCGSRAPAARRSTSRRSTASARSSFAFFDPEEAKALGRRLLHDARGRGRRRSATP